MPITARDPELKRRRGYTDRKTYVRVDGSEVLFRKDWTRRKQELVERSGGYCERVVMLHRKHEPGCHGRGGEPHHIKKRWPRRDDRIENLADLSHECHVAEDRRKVRWSAKRSAL
jgi:hypothetical protein